MVANDRLVFNMFEYIDYVRYDYDEDFDIYRLVDSHFECQIMVSSAATEYVTDWASGGHAPCIASVIVEYKKRNYSHKEIVKNLFRCSLFLSIKYGYCFEDTLKWQNKYLDTCFKDINFSKLYYKELKRLWNIHKVFL